MSRAGTIPWFVHHEARLAWRDWVALMTKGRRRRARGVVLVFLVIALFLHALAYQILASRADLTGAPDKGTLVVVTGALVLSWSFMLSQAMEAITKAFYARADLDLILASPVAAWRLFAVRIVAMAVTIVLMALALTAPFINVLVWRGGVRWLGGYMVAMAMAMLAVAVAVALTLALFRAIGPKLTRLIAQIVAAVIGAGFVIGLQFAAILTYGTMSQIVFLQSETAISFAPDSDSILWWPARAVLGDTAAVAGLFGFSVLALGAVINICAPRFGQLALATAGLSHGPARHGRRVSGFHNASPAQALRRKEWSLLRRDPWLISQSLMQLLYLLPAAYLLWRNFDSSTGVSVLLVPVLITAAGQLAGGLAWLAISGEDAPDLIASAPVPTVRVLRAKIEAVMGGIAIVFAPFIMALIVLSPYAAFVSFVGIAIVATSATSIQFWFRAQAKRNRMRRRQSSSRMASFSEALSSIAWAGTGGMAAGGTRYAVIPGIIALGIVAGAWMISPAKGTIAE